MERLRAQAVPLPASPGLHDPLREELATQQTEILRFGDENVIAHFGKQEALIQQDRAISARGNLGLSEQ